MSPPTVIPHSFTTSPHTPVAVSLVFPTFCHSLSIDCKHHPHTSPTPFPLPSFPPSLLPNIIMPEAASAARECDAWPRPMMMLASSSQNYFGDAWNVFDFIIVLGSFIDIIYTEVNVSTGRFRGVSYYALVAPSVVRCMCSFRPIPGSSLIVWFRYVSCYFM